MPDFTARLGTGQQEAAEYSADTVIEKMIFRFLHLTNRSEKADTD
jgi:hypothetical protein